MKKIFLGTFLIVNLVSLWSVCSQASAAGPAKTCYNANHQPIPCPEKRTKIPIPPTATATWTPAPKATPTPSPLTDPPLPAPPSVGGTCPAWPINTYGGLSLLVIGAISIIFNRSDTPSGYIGTHEISHGHLDTLDEYVEPGLSRGFRMLRFGFIAGGGLLAAAGILRNAGVLHCSWWPGLAGLGFGSLLALLQGGNTSGRTAGMLNKTASAAKWATTRAAGALQSIAKAAKVKLPSFLHQKPVSDSFRETGASRTRAIADDDGGFYVDEDGVIGGSGDSTGGKKPPPIGSS